MKLALIKWIKKGVEYHWHSGKCLVMPNISEMKEFFTIVKPFIFDDDGIKATIKHGYFVFDLCEIVEEIEDAEDICPKNEEM